MAASLRLQNVQKEVDKISNCDSFKKVPSETTENHENKQTNKKQMTSRKTSPS